MEGLAKGRVLLLACLLALVYAINGCGADNPVEIDTPKEASPFFIAGTQYRLDVRRAHEGLPVSPIVLVFNWVQVSTGDFAIMQSADTSLSIELTDHSLGAHFSFTIGICSVRISDAGYGVPPVEFGLPTRIEGLALEMVAFDPARPCEFLVAETWPPPNRHYTVTVVN